MFKQIMNQSITIKINPKITQTFNIIINDYLDIDFKYYHKLYNNAINYVNTNIKNLEVYNHLEVVELCYEWINAMELIKDANNNL